MELERAPGADDGGKELGPELGIGDGLPSTGSALAGVERVDAGSSSSTRASRASASIAAASGIALTGGGTGRAESGAERGSAAGGRLDGMPIRRSGVDGGPTSASTFRSSPKVSTGRTKNPLDSWKTSSRSSSSVRLG